MATRRTRTPAHHSAATEALRYRERVFEHALLVLLDFGTTLTLSPAQMQRAFRRARSGAHRTALGASHAYLTLLGISDILGDWYQQPEWLDESGKPRPLTVVGTRSFATLTERHLPHMNSTDLAQHLVREQILEQLPGGLLRPQRRAAVFVGQNPMSLDRVPVLLQGLLGTLAHNNSPKGRRLGTFCERGTTVSDLPVDQISAFNNFVKDLSQFLLDQTDAWARKRAAAPGSKTKTARVSVEVFTHREPAVGVASRSRRKVQK